MKTDRDALEAIRDYPLTNIADGDMLDALENIQGIAAAQLEGDDWNVVEQDETLEALMTDDDLRLDHIPDVKECREIRRRFAKDQFWPNVFHVNDHGNVDLLSIGYNGAKIVKSWV